MTSADDRVGDFALAKLEAEYFRRKGEMRYRDADEVREAICLARRWEFKR